MYLFLSLLPSVSKNCGDDGPYFYLLLKCLLAGGSQEMLLNKCFDQICTPVDSGNRKLAGSQFYTVYFAAQVGEGSLPWLCSSTGN